MSPPAADQTDRLREFVTHAKADPKRTLVALDVDGTVSAIAPSPGQARVGKDMLATLDRLSRRLHLWFISGRDTDEARRMIGIASAGYVGGHGLEVLDHGGLRPLLPMASLRRELAKVADAVAHDMPEVAPYIERKRWGVTFHYRELEDEGDLIERLRASIERRLTGDLHVLESKMAFEVRPAIEGDKGAALQRLIDD
jgi:trehalose 6-phosphate phosphatase